MDRNILSQIKSFSFSSIPKVFIAEHVAQRNIPIVWGFIV